MKELKSEKYKGYVLRFYKAVSGVKTHIYNKEINKIEIIAAYDSNTKKEAITKGKQWIDNIK